MNIYIKESQYNHPHHEVRVSGLINYINILFRGHYLPEEIEREAFALYSLDYYLQQITELGHYQFFINCSFNRYQTSLIPMILQGLKNLKATEYQRIFESVLITLKNLSEEAWELCRGKDGRQSENPEVISMLDTLDVFDNQFRELNPGLLNLIYRAIEKLPNLVVIPDEKYAEQMKILLDNVPNYEERLAAEKKYVAENEPEFSKIVKKICEKYQQKLISINALDYGKDIVGEEKAKQNSEEDHWYCHVTTEDGYYYITCDDKEAVLFHGPSKTALGSIKR